MDDRFAGAVAVLVGLGLAAVGTLEYVLPGLAPPPFDPFTTGVLVVATGLSLAGAGAVAVAAETDHLALRAASVVGIVALALALQAPGSMLFGGILWLALVFAGLVGAGAFRTVATARNGD